MNEDKNQVFEPTVKLVRPHTGSKLTVTLPKIEYNITEQAGTIPKIEAEQRILDDVLPQLYPGWKLQRIVKN